MRGFVLVPLIALLAGCSSWMPKPDPQQAWVDLDPNGQTTLQAVAVDGRTLDDDRFFQVPPGSRRLEMRYRFDVDGANIGPGSSSLAPGIRQVHRRRALSPGGRRLRLPPLGQAL